MKQPKSAGHTKRLLLRGWFIAAVNLVGQYIRFRDTGIYATINYSVFLLFVATAALAVFWTTKGRDH